MLQVARRAVFVVVLGMLAACGASKQSAQEPAVTRSTFPQNPTPPPDPCTLLSATEVAQALGAPVNAGTPGVGTPPETCTWAIPQAAAAGDGLQIAVKTTLSYANVRKNKDAIPSQKVYNIEMVDGIGTEAFFQTSPQANADGTSVLAVLYDGRAYFITVRKGGVPSQQIRAIEQAVAKIVIARV
ncbi:MAG: hypothetical protein ACOYN3_02305 [Acidimicrobiia bacterium]